MFDFRDVVAVASDSFHTLVLHSDGTVSGWGNNRSGELGDGTTVDRTIPTTVQGLKGVTAIAVGSSFSQAVGRSNPGRWPQRRQVDKRQMAVCHGSERRRQRLGMGRQ